MFGQSVCALGMALLLALSIAAAELQSGLRSESYQGEVAGAVAASDLAVEGSGEATRVTYDGTTSVLATDMASANENLTNAPTSAVNSCMSGCGGCASGCNHRHNPGCGCGQACNCDRCGERHYFVAEAVLWDIDQSENRVVVLNQNSGQAILTTEDADLGNQLGARITAGHWVCCDVAWEVSYFGFDDWDGVAVVDGNSDLRLAGDIGLAAIDDFFGADHMQLDASVEMHNLEINRVKRMDGTDLSWLFGFRYINFQEDFVVTATDADNSVSNYRVGTENNLFGGQFGGIWRRHENILGLEVFGKAGVFGTNLTQGQFLADLGNTFVIRDRRADWSTTSYVLEGGVTGLVRISDVWSARAGYNALFIDGLVRATDQLDFTDTLTSGGLIDDSGEAFMHGANVGLEARW